MHRKEMPVSRTSARTLLARQREQQALELRLGGASYARIGEALGMTAGGAYKAVDRLMARQEAESEEQTDKLRRLEAARCDRLLVGLWPRALRGDVQAIREALHISKRRSELLGLDAPRRQELSGPGGKPLVFDLSRLTDEELKILERIQAKLDSQ
jgi:DNA-binding CsgD family transcriptional regulator